MGRGQRENKEFKEDLAKGVVTLEWWDPRNLSDDFVWQAEERPTDKDNLWYKDNSKQMMVDDQWAQEKVVHLMRSGCHFKPQELEGDHPGCEVDKGKGKMFDEDEEEDQVLRQLKKPSQHSNVGIADCLEKPLLGCFGCPKQI